MNRNSFGRLLAHARLSAVTIAIALAAAAVPASANSMGTPEERAACEPEVFRLCSDFIPDVPKITSCLNRNVSKLNPACRAVMTGRPLPKAQRPAQTSER